jgi:arylsulfatase A-like enzyme
MDIAPALLESANAKIPHTMEAQSLLPALEGKPWKGRDYIFAEHPRDGILQEAEYMTMIRSKEWKLVHFLNEPFGQLFNLVDDPSEIHNLWDDPSAIDTKHELIHALYEWLIRSQYQTSDWSKEWR